MIIEAYSQDLKDFILWMKNHDLSTDHASHLFKSLYHFPMSFIDLPKIIGEKNYKLILESFHFELPKIALKQESQDGTIKLLVEMKDGLTVETVLIPFAKRYTVCLSSQVGCAMNCGFCYTGKQGFKRNLGTHEIVGQYLLARKVLKEKFPEALDPSIVFMGQGEPLHNAEVVKKAIEIFINIDGLHLGPRQITLSTVGYLPGLGELAKFHGINIALSLHSPFNEERTKIIPVNQHYPIEAIFTELEKVPLKKSQFINCEYLLLKGVNDTEAHADALKNLFMGKRIIMNLIPFNPFPGAGFERPSVEGVEIFKNYLVDRKIRVMVRTTKGDEILAACGQLNTKLSNSRELLSK